MAYEEANYARNWLSFTGWSKCSRDTSQLRCLAKSMELENSDLVLGCAWHAGKGSIHNTRVRSPIRCKHHEPDQLEVQYAKNKSKEICSAVLQAHCKQQPTTGCT